MRNLFWILVLIFSFSACEKISNKVLIDPKDELYFEITKTNSDNDYESFTQDFKLIEKKSDWLIYPPGNLYYIRKNVTYEVTLANGELIEMNILISLYDEDKSLVTLDEETKSKDWDYISTEVEAKNFYKTDNVSYIKFGHNFFLQDIDVNPLKYITVTKVETALVEGKEKSYVTIEFNGYLEELFDPYNDPEAVYEISNGKFKGIIE